MSGKSWSAKRACAAVCCLLWAGVIFAHSDHDVEIDQLGHQLEESSATDTDALSLLLRRADLHRQQAHWQAALADYRAVERIQVDNQRMLLGTAQLYMDQREFLAASQWSERLLSIESDHIQALLVQARAQTGLGNPQRATDTFARAIKLMETPTPEHFLEHAQIVLQTSKENAAAEAIAIVDAGASRLGHPVSLHSFALERELEQGQELAAVERIEKVLARYPVLLLWQLHKAELLLSLQRADEACLTLKNVENKLQQLPPQRGKSRAMQAVSASAAQLQLSCSG